MKTAIQTACNDIIDELIDTIELAHLTKIISIMHKHLETEKQQIIDAQNYSQRGVDGEIYYNMVYSDTTNKETLK